MDGRGERWLDRTELRHLLLLMLPLYIGNLMQIGMGVIDTVVAGRAGAGELAAVALGCSFTAPIICSVGVIISMVGPMISRLRGAGAAHKVGYLLLQTKWLALALTAVELLLLGAAVALMPCVSGDAHLVSQARLYLLFYMTGIPANLLLRVVLANFEGHAQTRPGMVFSFLGMLINVPLNYLFVFGLGGFPALGGAGCGLATAIIFWGMALGLLLTMAAAPQHRANCRRMLAWRKPELALCRRIFRLGLPVGIATLSEVGFFNVIIIVLAPLGDRVVAAQQVAISVSSLIFMFPLSMSFAASIRLAYHVGAGNAVAFYRSVRTSVVATLGGVLLFMVVTLLCRHAVIALYTDDAQVRTLAATLLLLCALYQVPDGIQSLMNGLLRGCQDTAAISRVTTFCYWCVGLPLALVLIRTDWLLPAMGAAGAWVSFIVSLTLTAIMLTRRFRCTAKALFPAEKP